jgi:endonuclease/exonuclease/phosphatase family metal-dependent hydrolase
LPLAAREFTVLVYNVENLFDVDGVALYSDYGPEHLLNKLEAIRTTLAAVGDGTGPEVILFQEFELDRTPYDTPAAAEFLERNRGRSVEQVLRQDRTATNLPVELLLLKYLEDNGLTDYHIAQPDPAKMESHSPHKNVVFSRFPVKEVRQRPMLRARDLLVAVLDVDGHELVVLNNHWKSGASNPETEPIRVQNARVVRAEVEAILFENPQADLLIGGDLNSYYNHEAAFPDLEETAVNDVLRANGFESRMVVDGSRNLYNLWFELDPDERGSEVYQGKWGTLMQLIVAPGLYDRRGIQYVDNSFGRLMLPDLNVETRWSRPIAWSNLGGGAGFSDHLPIYARFRVVGGPGEDGWMALDDPTDEELDAYRLEVPFARMDRRAVPPVDILADMTDAQRVQLIGDLFVVDSTVVSVRPLMIQTGDLRLQVYSPIRDIRTKLDQLRPGDRLHAFADLDEWRGKLQVVVRDDAWLLAR